MKPLLLLVDLQRDYLDSLGLGPPASAIVRRAADLLQGCRAADIDVAHVWTTVNRETDERMPHWKRQGRWLCEEGTPGHAPPPELKPLPGEPVIHKTHFSPFSRPALSDLLNERGTDLLILCGVHLHGCVREAVLGAYERGLQIQVAADAVGSNDPVHAAITRRYLEARAASFLSVEGILAGLDDTTPAKPPLPIPDPTGRVPSSASSSPASADRVPAVAASCRAAQPDWSLQPLESRLEVLGRLAAAVETAAPEIAEQMAAEIGKPVRFGSMEAHRTAQMLHAIAARAREPNADGLRGASLHHRPLGVVAVVTPWNNPIYIPLGKIAPALAYGNGVLWKPAPAAQPIADRITSLIADAGLPPGVLGVVAGGRGTAQAAMADPSVDAVSITGSSAAGYSAQEACARRRIPLQAELGGNNAALVWVDADLELAATELAEGAFAQAGQRCTANRRAVIHASRADQLLELLRARTAALSWGDPRDPAVTVGPIVDDPARERITAAVADAAGLATLIEVPHGSNAPSSGAPQAPWYPPTIICCDDAEAEIVQEETFGPVLVIQRAGDWDEAMDLVGGVHQGLASAIFSSSPELIERFEREVPAGIVKVNRSTADAEVDVPFGGWKASGIGPPEHGAFDRDFYTRPQVVYP
ncbi:MAG TPA: aldehyde dehydrogenase family protein [Solirubrobacterales bacterium]|nr:aldehyde dehydrogenase family protein [Solirubrobacterales bacterium]